MMGEEVIMAMINATLIILAFGNVLIFDLTRNFNDLRGFTRWTASNDFSASLSSINLDDGRWIFSILSGVLLKGHLRVLRVCQTKTLSSMAQINRNKAIVGAHLRLYNVDFEVISETGLMKVDQARE